MSELDPGVEFIKTEMESRNGVFWKEYSFAVDGEDFVVEGPLLNMQPALFDETEDVTPQEIDVSVNRINAERQDIIKQKWTTLKFDIVALGVMNVIVSPLVLSDSGNRVIEKTQMVGAIDGCVLALTGAYAVIQAKKLKKEADRVGKIADNFKRTRPYFENLEARLTN